MNDEHILHAGKHSPVVYHQTVFHDHLLWPVLSDDVHIQCSAIMILAYLLRAKLPNIFTIWLVSYCQLTILHNISFSTRITPTKYHNSQCLVHLTSYLQITSIHIVSPSHKSVLLGLWFGQWSSDSNMVDHLCARCIGSSCAKSAAQIHLELS